MLRSQSLHGGHSGHLHVYKPGSIVGRLGAQGVLHDIEIIEPEIIVEEGGPKLFYRYRLGPSGKAMVAADLLEATGDEYSLIYWNPETGEYIDNVDDLVARSIDQPITLSDSISASESEM